MHHGFTSDSSGRICLRPRLLGVRPCRRTLDTHVAAAVYTADHILCGHRVAALGQWEPPRTNIQTSVEFRDSLLSNHSHSVHLHLLQYEAREITLLGHSVPPLDVCRKRDDGRALLCQTFELDIRPGSSGHRCWPLPTWYVIHGGLLSLLSSKEDQKVVLGRNSPKDQVLLHW